MYAKLSSRNKAPKFAQFDVLSIPLRLSNLNGVSNRYFLSHIYKLRGLMPSNMLRQNFNIAEFDIFTATEHESKVKV